MTKDYRFMPRYPCRGGHIESNDCSEVWAARMSAIRRFPAAILATAIVLAACGSGSASPARSGSPGAPSASSGVVPSDAPSSGPKVSQTNTEWGRIWDGLPAGFPPIPGATPDEATGSPASAVLIVDGTAAQSVATFLQTELQKAGYTAVGSTEPLEDGSYVLEMTGTPDGCMLQATVKPTGGLTTVTILYGTGCPFG